MGKKIRISDAEWRVMEVAWDDPPVTAQQVTDALGKKEDWKPQTIKTLLGRLVSKGALSYQTQANRYLYSPVISRQEAVAQEAESFLERIGRASLAPLLAHMVEAEKPLDTEELNTLRALLENNSKRGEDQL